MSAHDWPEFESFDTPMRRTAETDKENDWVAVNRSQYNYAKVRIDACAGLPDEAISGVMKGTAHNYAAFKRIEVQRDALQQRCEELLTDNAKMKQLLLHFLYHHQGASSVIGQPIRILFGMNDHEHMTDDQIAIAKQVQPCNTPTK